MPCPFFEPQRPADEPGYAAGRLPLVDEYAGLCHLNSPPSPAPAQIRLTGCNLGNLEPVCPQLNWSFQASRELPPVTRFSVQRRQAATLHLIVVEEAAGAPVSWQQVEFKVATQQIVPEISGLCRQAQALAFCRSYLARFPFAPPQSQLHDNHERT